MLKKKTRTEAYTLKNKPPFSSPCPQESSLTFQRILTTIYKSGQTFSIHGIFFNPKGIMLCT